MPIQNGGTGPDTLVGTTGSDTLNGDAGNDVLSGLGGNDQLDGGDGNDSVDGGDGNDGLIGGNGDDTLLGGNGDDYFNGAAGADWIDGGAGTDGVDYAGESSGVNANLSTGIVLTPGGTDTLTGVENINGSAFNDTLTGDSNANGFTPGTGNDSVVGNGNAGDWVSYEDASGGVTVNLASGTASGANGNDTLVGVFGLHGSHFADVLVLGNSGSSYVFARAGNDTITAGTSGSFIVAGAGNDVINGSATFDTLSYEDDSFDSVATTGSGVTVNLVTGTATDNWGNTDTFTSIELVRGSQFGDTLIGGNPANGSGATDGFEGFHGNGGSDSISGGTGFDRAYYTSSTSAINVQLSSGSVQDGLGGNDTLSSIEEIFASNFNDTLTGSGAGFESFQGFAGNDTIDGKGGTDRVTYANSTNGVAVNLATGTASDGWGGTDTLLNIEQVRGSDIANDTLTGDSADNQLEGRGGNDTLAGGGGNDTLIGGTGNDFLDGGTENPTLGQDIASYAGASGAVDANLLTGLVTGADGNDTLTNVERIWGSNFADTITGSNGANILRGNAGNDLIAGNGGQDGAEYSAASGGVTVSLVTNLAAGADGNDTLSGIEDLRGSNFADSLEGDGFNNELRGNAGNDTLVGGLGFDTADYRNATSGVTVSLVSNTSSGGDGADTLTSIEALRGTFTFDDSLTGDSGNNRLEGLGGNDTLMGGAGQDTLTGGDGNDVIDGGTITDRINYTDLNVVSYSGQSSGATVNLATGVAQDGGGGTDTLLNVNFVTGSSFADRITGSAAHIFEQFTGGLGNDTIDGGLIDGDTGANSNRVTYQGASGAVNVDLGAGVATGADGIDTLFNINNVRGSAFGDVLTGSNTTAWGEQFEGRAGDDTIDGKGGIDSLRVEDATSAVTANLVTGIATGGGIGTDTFTNIEGIRASNFDDTLVGGNSANDALEFFLGLAGNDSIDGGSGFDRAEYTTSTAGVNVVLSGNGIGSAQDGLGGNDMLIGIEGVRASEFDDTLTGTDVATLESFEGRGGFDVIDGKGGRDRVDYITALGAVNVDLANGVAHDDGYGSVDMLAGIEDARGSAWDDTLTGDAGANTLEGRKGNDTIDAGAGSDTAVFRGNFNQYAIENGAVPGEYIVTGPDGRDVVRNVETLQFDDRTLSLVFGSQNPDTVVIGAGLGTVLYDAGDGNDVVTANDSGNALLGGGGNDSLRGGAGSDNLDGGTGTDTMAGGLGDDVYVVDSSSDVVIEVPNNVAQTFDPLKPREVNLGGGVDRVLASVDYTLGDFVENLAMSAAAGNLSGTGNALNNRLEGNGGNNSLSGLGGNDTLKGGAGNDTMDGGAGRDTAVFSGSASAYTITISGANVTVSGADGVDVLSNIERAQFDDFQMAFDLDDNAGDAYRLYQAAFDRVPDIGGVGFQMNQLDLGRTLASVAQDFLNSPEFQSKYGNVSDAQYVTLLYQNVLHRTPAQEEIDFHVIHELQAGYSRAQVLTFFSDSPENQANVIGAIEHGIIFLF